MQLCPDGGIGRRARLKIWLSQGSAGSIPVLGTNASTRKCRGVFFWMRFELAQKSRQRETPGKSEAFVEALSKPLVEVKGRRRSRQSCESVWVSHYPFNQTCLTLK